MSGAIAIFVKTPGYSAVKTRLAVTLGAALAEEWHRRAAAVVAEVARAAAAVGDATVYWAIAEPAAQAAGAWPDLPTLPQGEGDLGSRMSRVHAELVRRHAYGLLLGADAPQLAVDDVRAAMAWCAPPAPRQVIGPARDGGFWLYGANRTTADTLWSAVAYSRPDTAQDFRTAFAERGEWLELRTLTDVDQGDDLAVMQAELTALTAPTPAQRALGAWLRERQRGPA